MKNTNLAERLLKFLQSSSDRQTALLKERVMNAWQLILRWVLKHSGLNPFDARRLYLRLRGRISSWRNEQ